MTLQEIKQAISEGKKVHWKNEHYEVIKDNIGQYLIHCHLTNHYIGLTWADNKTLNGKESEFFIQEQPENIMYKITVTRDVLLNETINAHYWLAYHSLNSLYGIPETEIDKAFARADKGLEHTLEFNGKTFTVELIEVTQSQMRKDLQLTVSLLTPEISTAEDEDRPYIRLELGFVTNMQKILTRILKSM